MLLTRVTNLAANARVAMLDGREYMACPMTMIAVGVLNGNSGPLYYPADELSKTPASWNMKPVVVYHPQNSSATDPVVLETQAVGMIMNAEFRGNKLIAEAWIDPIKANRIDPRIMQAIEAGTVMEVSTGLFVDRRSTPGEYNGKQYVAVAHNFRPDHLALLPDQKGACSINDGCGLLQTNKQKPLGLPSMNLGNDCGCKPAETPCPCRSQGLAAVGLGHTENEGQAATGGKQSPLGLPSMDW